MSETKVRKIYSLVGFDPELKKKLTNTDHSIAGAVSGSVTRFLFQPLDVIKIRFQLQIEPIRKSSTSSKYKGMIHAFPTIVKEEGISSLWKGHIPAQFLSILYGTLQFVSFEYLTLQAWKYLPSELNENYKPSVHFACGGVAGCISIIGVQPFDVIRTRLVAQGEPKTYRGMTNAVISMVKYEGPRSLYKGLSPSLIQILPYTGAQFGFYRLFLQMWSAFFNSHSQQKLNWLQTTACGASAGMGAKIIVYPLDVIKKRLQIQGFEKAREKFGIFRKYNGVIDCLLLSVKDEGIKGLYKGFYPSVLKAALVTGSHFFVYEQVCYLLIIKRYTKETK